MDEQLSLFDDGEVLFSFSASLDQMVEEMVTKTVAQQQAKLKAYKVLKERGLRIPPDLQRWADDNIADGELDD